MNLPWASLFWLTLRKRVITLFNVLAGKFYTFLINRLYLGKHCVVCCISFLLLVSVDILWLNPGKMIPGKMAPGKMIPGKNGPRKIIPKKNDPWKNDPRKIDPRKIDPRKIGPRKNGYQKNVTNKPKTCKQKIVGRALSIVVFAWNVRNKPRTRKHTQNSETKNRGAGVEHRDVSVECSKRTQNSQTNPKLGNKKSWGGR